LYRRRNTPVKERILLGRIIPSLQTVDIIVTKIAAVPPTVHPTVVVVTDGLAAEVEPPTDLKDVATSARKRTAAYRSTQRRNATRLRKSTETASTTELKDGLTTTLRNALNSTSSTTKETIVKT
jgi:hypothetical protein